MAARVCTIWLRFEPDPDQSLYSIFCVLVSLYWLLSQLFTRPLLQLADGVMFLGAILAGLSMVLSVVPSFRQSACLWVRHAKWSGLLQIDHNVPRQYLYRPGTFFTLKGKRSKSRTPKCRYRFLCCLQNSRSCLTIFLHLREHCS